MSAVGSADSNRRHPVVLDLTRIRDLSDAKRIFLNIRDDDNVSVLVNDDMSFNNYIAFASENNYNLYGYTHINSNFNTFNNYSTDIARVDTVYIDEKSKNRYSNYKYAYHYPLTSSNWNKFSRYKIRNNFYKMINLGYGEYGYNTGMYTHDFYSFISLFDSTIQSYFPNHIDLDNSNYIDFQKSNPASNEYVDDKPVEYHGRNIYIDKKIIYLKIKDAMALDRNKDTKHIVACKYMVIELDGPDAEKPVRLDSLFTLCNTHAYILTNESNKLKLIPIKLLADCKATKFGDPSDSRTLLNLSNVNNIYRLCYQSNIEDMSMHRIELDGTDDIILTEAFYKSKIRKLPKGLSLSKAPKNILAKNMFAFAKDIEDDISKINLPTLSVSNNPPNRKNAYNMNGMYQDSSCRHINRSIISTNNENSIWAEDMYKNTTLIEDSPLPDGMFKNYEVTGGMFKNVIFETADTFKYIYGEFSKDNVPLSTVFNDITIKNNIRDYKTIIKSSDNKNINIMTFTANSNIEPNSELIRMSIIGRRRGKYLFNQLNITSPICKELSVGCTHKDLQHYANLEIPNPHDGQVLPIDFRHKLKKFSDESDSTSGFFQVITPSRDVMPAFRRLALLLIGNDYYDSYTHIFDGIFQRTSKQVTNKVDNYSMTTILYSNTTEAVDMFSLDEISRSYLKEYATRRQYNDACAIINTNGKNLKWTLSRYHYLLWKQQQSRYDGEILRYCEYVSIFTNPVYLYRAIDAQMYFTKEFVEEKIEFIFRALDVESLKQFLALMSLYMDPNDPKKPVGRYILLYNDSMYDSKTDMARINALASFNQSYIDEIKTNTDLYDDGFIFRDEV